MAAKKATGRKKREYVIARCSQAGVHAGCLDFRHWDRDLTRSALLWIQSVHGCLTERPTAKTVDRVGDGYGDGCGYGDG